MSRGQFIPCVLLWRGGGGDGENKCPWEGSACSSWPHREARELSVAVFRLAKIWVLQCCLWFWFGWSKEVLENTRKSLKPWTLTRHRKGVGKGPHLWIKNADKVNTHKSNMLVLEQLLAGPEHEIGNQYLHTGFGLLLLKLWSGLEVMTIYREYENYFVAQIKHSESPSAIMQNFPLLSLCFILIIYNSPL